MSADAKQHWERVYAEKATTAVSWYQVVPARSLVLIGEAVARVGASGRRARVIDVGGGASTLVDHLVERLGGDLEVCVMDIAGAALAAARARLGEKAGRTRWVESDVTGAMAEIEDGWADVWHDRAVFHFLTSVEQRRAYAANLQRVLAPGGVVVIAGFAPDGPLKCSGLEVARHDGESIRRELEAGGLACVLEKEEREDHTTPWGAAQRFVYGVLRRRPE
ncbi:MAG: methyltransferase [Phycisphaerales bacterium]